MYTVVGLGNPGDKYQLTRHNAGRMAANFLKDNLGDKTRSLEVFIPNSYMNESGRAIQKFLKEERGRRQLIVIYDDLDLPLGKFKISFNRSSGGHKGVESIIQTLKTKSFIRIRIGIAPTGSDNRLKRFSDKRRIDEFLLSDFKKSEMRVLEGVFKQVVEAVKLIVEKGKYAAMTKFNR